MISRGAHLLWGFFDYLSKRSGGWVRPSLRYLMGRYKKSRATISRWIAELRLEGFIEVRRRGPRSAEYILLVRPNETSFETSNETSFRSYLFSESKPEKKEKAV